jgi:hypothetical protein
MTRLYERINVCLILVEVSKVLRKPGARQSVVGRITIAQEASWIAAPKGDEVDSATNNGDTASSGA